MMDEKGIAQVIYEHQPYWLNWSCACGDMDPSDFRGHKKAHSEHVAAVLVAGGGGWRP